MVDIPESSTYLVALYAQPEISLSTIQPVCTTTTPQNTTHNHHNHHNQSIEDQSNTYTLAGLEVNL